MRTGLCRLCLSQKPLCKSHALPNSLFNYILRRNSGKAIVIVDDASTPAYKSSDTWHDELLCEGCEEDLNTRYDAYGMAVFRGHEGSVRIHRDGVDLLKIDRARLRMFFLSVLWRISISSHPSYSNIDLPHDWEEDLRSSLEAKTRIPESRYSVALFRMRDTTPIGGFSNDDLRSIIAAPFARKYSNFISICFPFLGFFVEVFFPRVPSEYMKRRGVIHGRSPVLSVPYVEALDIPELMNTLVSALRKELGDAAGAA